MRDFDVVIIDNSGSQSARETLERAGFGPQMRAQGQESCCPGLHIIENTKNLGFGAAVNQAYLRSKSPFLATLNDDAVADPHWIEELLVVMDSMPDVGMCASQVRLAGSDVLDSAG